MQSFAWARAHNFISPCLESNQTPMQKWLPSRECFVMTILIFLDNKQTNKQTPACLKQYYTYHYFLCLLPCQIADVCFISENLWQCAKNFW